MGIVKLIIRKLDYNLTGKEEADFRSWMDESYTNEFMFYRLEALKSKGKDVSEVIELDAEFAWKSVKRRLK